MYRLMPRLIEAGKVFIAETPLFEIICKGRRDREETTHFAFDEREKAEILAKLGNERCTIQRSKGLGENNADMMWLTTMNPETRRLIQIVPAEAALTAAVFDLLLGDNLTGRKAHIEQNGSRYIEDLDIG
jgi:DNA gyrase subunit B